MASGRLSPPCGPPASPSRSAKYRPDEPRRLLPQLPLKWYQEAAAADGAELNYEQSRELIYGMPYSEYKARHQTAATPEQQAAFEQNSRLRLASSNRPLNRE